MLQGLARLIFLSLAVLALGACTSQYTSHLVKQSLKTVKVKDTHHLQRTNTWTINSTTPVFLAKAVSLSSLDDDYPRTNLELHQQLKRTLSQTFPAFSSGERAVGLSEALTIARGAGSELLFIPKLIDRHNNLNSWQELSDGQKLHRDKRYGRDYLAVQVLVYEVRTSRLLDIATMKSHARIFAASGDHPKHLLHQAINHYVLSISGHRAG